MNTAISGETGDARVEVRNADRWINFSMNLAEDFTGGPVVRMAPGVRAEIEAADELAATCTETNWLSGIASGAFYAYRTLKSPRRVVVITHLTGRLRASDMSALAYAAAQSVTRFLKRDLAITDLDGWQEVHLEGSSNGTKPVAPILE